MTKNIDRLDVTQKRGLYRISTDRGTVYGIEACHLSSCFVKVQFHGHDLLDDTRPALVMGGIIQVGARLELLQATNGAPLVRTSEV